MTEKKIKRVKEAGREQLHDRQQKSGLRKVIYYMHYSNTEVSPFRITIFLRRSAKNT
ncbi:hypothetical protein SAMN05444128_0332 [Pontibacter indicus]|uniref:Uncharacterized protein n=1 Tax=Pontibacter indicus TaxID=1317125 RepID=A0A1R3WG67_9BACT|nr:hypothetical protein SAMN05444128_0332 [Pontibacter indicus]